MCLHEDLWSKIMLLIKFYIVVEYKFILHICHYSDIINNYNKIINLIKTFFHIYFPKYIKQRVIFIFPICLLLFFAFQIAIKFIHTSYINIRTQMLYFYYFHIGYFLFHVTLKFHINMITYYLHMI